MISAPVSSVEVLFVGQQPFGVAHRARAIAPVAFPPRVVRQPMPEAHPGRATRGPVLKRLAVFQYDRSNAGYHQRDQDVFHHVQSGSSDRTENEAEDAVAQLVARAWGRS